MSDNAADDIRIVPTGEEYVEGFNAAVAAVARERRYLLLVDGPPMDGSRDFVRFLLNGGGVQYFAVTRDDVVVGWCDIVCGAREGLRHAAHLGMGVLAEYRGRGLGERLARAAMDAAWSVGIERIELEVFASNTRAIALYERLGFVREGMRRRARKIDGGYDDNVIMAVVKELVPSRT